MEITWQIHTVKNDFNLTLDELIEKIHQGMISINDWVKVPEQEVWSQIFSIETITDFLLFEYIKNDCCYGPITGKELKSFHSSSKIQKNTPVKVCGQELWHRYMLILRYAKQDKEFHIALPAVFSEDLVPERVKWTFSDFFVVAFTVASVATFFTCYCCYGV